MDSYKMLALMDDIPDRREKVGTFPKINLVNEHHDDHNCHLNHYHNSPYDSTLLQKEETLILIDLIDKVIT